MPPKLEGKPREGASVGGVGAECVSARFNPVQTRISTDEFLLGRPFSIRGLKQNNMYHEILPKDALQASNESHLKIVWHYNRCLQQFTELLRLLRSDHGNFSTQISLPELQDELGRYQIWAGNHGCHRTGQMSLDHRLREAPELYQQVKKLLGNLQRVLDNAVAIVSESRKPHEVLESLWPSNRSDSSKSSMEEELNTRFQESSHTTELQECIFGINYAITSLYKFLIVIRNPAPRDPLAKAAREDVSYYTDFEVLHLKDKFKGVEDLGLLERLAKANLRRRQLFKYYRTHSNTVANGMELSGVSEVLDNLPNERNENVTASEQRTPSHKKLPENSAVGSRIANTYTTLSTIKPRAKIKTPSESGRTTFSYATSAPGDHKKKLIPVPQPPNPECITKGIPFLCPYCLDAVEVREWSSWEHHVYSDLRPYICMFGNCARPDQLYTSFNRWCDHERKVHRREWYCDACEMTFSKRHPFKAHLEQNHAGSFSDDQLATLVDLCERGISSAQQCPLCPKNKSNPNHFQQHLGKHLQQLALFTLPRSYDEKDDNDAKEGGAIGGSSSNVREGGNQSDGFLGTEGSQQLSQGSTTGVVAAQEAMESVPDADDLSWDFVRSRNNTSDLVIDRLHPDDRGHLDFDRQINPNNPKASTLSVRNLPPLTTESDIKNYFSSAILDSEPCVGPIVPDSHVNALCTTVTLKSEEACKLACERLNGREFRATRGQGGGGVRVSWDFMGLNALEEHENPLFDLYFVHGIGGHAFDSWASPISKNSNHASLKMWPRDLLPQRFEASGLHGRFSTLGYNANVFRDTANTTIESAAIELLYHLRNDRPEDCRRPIFFCAHSLGGLVVAQALVLALDPEVRKDDDIYLEGLVKGIIFMGTPFWGSFTASTIAPFIKILEKLNRHHKNADLVASLRANDTDLSDLVAHFSQIRYQHEIDVKIFYESQAVGPALVTHPSSATATFGEFISPVPINANHVDMIKFSSTSDPRFRSLSEEIIRMTRKKLGISASVAPPPQRSSTVGGVGVSTIAQYQAAPTPHVHRAEHNITGELPTRRTFSRDNHINQQTQTHPQAPLAQTVEEFPGAQWQSNVRSHPPNLDGLTILNIPKSSHPLGAEDKLDLSRLAEWDIVFIVDDTASMQLLADKDAPVGSPSRWDLVVEALRYIANEAAKRVDDGVDIHFLVSKGLNGAGVKSGQAILDLLGKVDVETNSGGTRFEPALHPYISKCLRDYKKYLDALDRGEEKEPPKPMKIIVLTDGAADDKMSTERLLVYAGKELDKMFAPSFQLGVQFVQVGDDEAAKVYLDRLDKRLREQYTIRDFVDTRPYKGVEPGFSFGDNLAKILLAAMDRGLDSDEEDEDEGYR